MILDAIKAFKMTNMSISRKLLFVGGARSKGQFSSIWLDLGNHFCDFLKIFA